MWYFKLGADAPTVNLVFKIEGDIPKEGHSSCYINSIDVEAGFGAVSKLSLLNLNKMIFQPCSRQDQQSSNSSEMRRTGTYLYIINMCICIHISLYVVSKLILKASGKPSILTSIVWYVLWAVFLRLIIFGAIWASETSSESVLTVFQWEHDENQNEALPWEFWCIFITENKVLKNIKQNKQQH